jgi:integrase
VRVPHLSPTTLTIDEQRAILRVTTGNVRDHLIFSLALGTGLRLAEIVGLDVADVFAPDGTSWRSAKRPESTRGEFCSVDCALVVRRERSLELWMRD